MIVCSSANEYIDSTYLGVLLVMIKATTKRETILSYMSNNRGIGMIEVKFY